MFGKRKEAFPRLETEMPTSSIFKTGQLFVLLSIVSVNECFLLCTYVNAFRGLSQPPLLPTPDRRHSLFIINILSNISTILVLNESSRLVLDYLWFAIWSSSNSLVKETCICQSGGELEHRSGHHKFAMRRHNQLFSDSDTHPLKGQGN